MIIPIFTKVYISPRLGKDNPNANLYKVKKTTYINFKKKTTHGLSLKARPAVEHAGYFDVYVRGVPCLGGYESIYPKVVDPKFDNDMRMHSSTGPAFAAEGFAFYYWHGIQVPPDFIVKKDKLLTAEYIFGIRNMELRRCAIDIVGWDNILAHVQHRVLDKNRDPQIGELIEAQIPTTNGQHNSFDDEGEDDSPPTRGYRGRVPKNPRGFERHVLLRVQCGTGRFFSIPVHPQCRTALEAQAWMWNVPPGSFKPPAIRT
jgi:hypothetical protein